MSATATKIGYLQNLIDHKNTSAEERAAATRMIARLRAKAPAEFPQCKTRETRWKGDKYDG